MTVTPSTASPGARRKRALVWLLVVVNTLATINVVRQAQYFTRLSRPADGIAIVRVTDVQLRDNHTVALSYEADLDALEAIEANNSHFSGATRNAHYRRSDPSTLPGKAAREATWHLPPPLTRADTAKVVELVRRNWLGQDITLTDAGLKMLFGITNSSGDRFHGFLRLTVATPASTSPPASGVAVSAPVRGLRVSASGRKVFGLQFTAGEASLLTCEFILRRGDRNVCLPGLSACVITSADGPFNGSLMWFAPPAAGDETATWELRTYDAGNSRDSLVGEVTLPDLEPFDWRHEAPLAPVNLAAGEVRELPLFRAATEAGAHMEVLVRVQRVPLPSELQQRYPHGGLFSGLPAGHITPAVIPPVEQRKRKSEPVRSREAGPVRLAQHSRVE